MSFHDIIKITQADRDNHIDRVLALMAYGIDQEFEFLFGEWDSTTSYSYFETLSKSVHDEMVHEKLILSQKRERKGKGYHRIQLTVEGNRIKQAGGWIKHKKLNKVPLTSNKWFGIMGWGLATLASLMAIIQPFQPDDALEIQRQEFINNNRPQLELHMSAFYGTDPLLNGSTLQDTSGITGSYWLTNVGKSNITLEQVTIPNDLKVRGYFADKVIDLPYSLNPTEQLLITCELPNKNRPITRTESALKGTVIFTCSHPSADATYECKFTWDTNAGLFLSGVRVEE